MADAVGTTSLSRILTSDWGRLNPNLIARFYPLKRNAAGTGWEQSRAVRELSAADKYSVDDGFEVHCPISDASQEMSLNWTSPYEGAGAESKAPTLSSMLQSGLLSSNLQAALATGGLGGSSTAQSAGNILRDAMGRTGITKLNSTQVFSGMPPVKITLTAHFRAITDPVKEVRDPLSQLEEWGVPQFLADEGIIAGSLKNGLNQSPLQTIYPSVAPQILAMRYGDMTYQPIVIESMSKPITNPRNEDGVMINCSVQLNIGTLAAWDRRDIKSLYL